jgi:hypothetical protein
VRSDSPAAAKLGVTEFNSGRDLFMVKVDALDSDPLQSTVMFAVPGVRRRASGIVVLRVVPITELSYIALEIVVPFHEMAQPDTKFSPVTVRLTYRERAIALVRDRLVSLGGETTVSVRGYEMSSPSRTRTLAAPVEPDNEGRITAVIDLASI